MKLTRRLPITLFSMAIFFSSFGQSDYLQWAKTVTGVCNGYTGSLQYNNASLYWVGIIFQDTVVIADTILTTPDLAGTTFITKFNAAGTFKWAVSTGPAFSIWARQMITDNHGNCYIAGVASGDTIVIGDSIFIPPTYYPGFFIAKYDSNGNYLWARVEGTTADADIGSVTIDKDGYVYVAGCYAADSLRVGSLAIYGGEDGGVFLAKYDSAGNIYWLRGAAQQWNNGSNSTISTLVTCDGAGNVFVAGAFLGDTLTFNNTSLANTVGESGQNCYLAKFTGSGDFIWAKSYGGDNSDAFNSISTNNTGIYLAGNFYDHQLSFGPYTLVNADTSASSTDIFVLNCDTSGNPIWAQRAGGTGNEGVGELKTDITGNAYITGGFGSSSIMFGNTTLVNDTAGNYEYYVAAYNSSGIPLWADGGHGKQMGGVSVASDNQGSVYTLGLFNPGPALFDNQITAPAFPGQTEGVFLAKYGECALANPVIISSGAYLSVNSPGTYQWYLNDTAIAGATQSTYTATLNGEYSVVVANGPCKASSQTLNFTALSIIEASQQDIRMVPNPTTNQLLIEGILPYKIKVFNTSGQLVKVLYNTNLVTMSELADGLYLIRLSDLSGNEIYAQKIVKQ